MSSAEIETLATWFDEARSAVFFGGAGVSTASGIPDFRSAAGLYAAQAGGGRSPEYLLSHDCLMEEPEAFFAFDKEITDAGAVVSSFALEDSAVHVGTGTDGERIVNSGPFAEVQEFVGGAARAGPPSCRGGGSGGTNEGPSHPRPPLRRP